MRVRVCCCRYTYDRIIGHSLFGYHAGVSARVCVCVCVCPHINNDILVRWDCQIKDYSLMQAHWRLIQKFATNTKTS